MRLAMMATAVLGTAAETVLGTAAKTVLGTAAKAVLGAAVLAVALTSATATAQTRQGPPHDWVLGVWTGGMFPAVDTEGPACFGATTVIFTRDVVLRASSLDVAYRQRVIETAAARASGLEFRFVPVATPPGLLGARQPFDLGFGCPGGADVLRVERRGPDEIAFPDCDEFPSPLKRCVSR